MASPTPFILWRLAGRNDLRINEYTAWGASYRCSGTPRLLALHRLLAPPILMPDTMLFAWMGDDVEAILLVFAVTVALVAIGVVLDLKLRGL